jgi:hypothetical protein
MSLLH